LRRDVLAALDKLQSNDEYRKPKRRKTADANVSSASAPEPSTPERPVDRMEEQSTTQRDDAMAAGENQHEQEAEAGIEEVDSDDEEVEADIEEVDSDDEEVEAGIEEVDSDDEDQEDTEQEESDAEPEPEPEPESQQLYRKRPIDLVSLSSTDDDEEWFARRPTLVVNSAAVDAMSLSSGDDDDD
jgi:hypothetical protein